MPRTSIPAHDVADLALAPEGQARIAWAAGQMPVLAQIRERFAAERPLEGFRIAACLHVTAETANLVRTLRAGGATVGLCSANPLSTQDDVAAALVLEDRVEVHAHRGEDIDTYVDHVLALLSTEPQITLDDGADLLITAHARGGDALDQLIGGTEETTTGLVRLRRLEEEGGLRCPVLAVNEARTERALNDRHGTGQSALDGIVRASQRAAGRQHDRRPRLWLGRAGRGRACPRRRRGGRRLRGRSAARAGGADGRLRGDDLARGRRARGHLHHRHRLAASAAPGALRAHEGRRAAGQRRPLRRRARPQRARRAGHRRHPRRSGHSSRSTCSPTAGGSTCWPTAASSTWRPPRAIRRRSWTSPSRCRRWASRNWFAVAASSRPGVHPVPPAVDREVGRLKLAALGVRIDEPTPEQEHYRESWSPSA